jgi:Bacterial PH domain
VSRGVAAVAAAAPVTAGVFLFSADPRTVDRVTGVMFVLGAAFGYWLFAVRPRLTLRADRLVVQNPVRRHDIAMSAVLGARAGYSGIVIDVRPNRTVVAWAVQKSNLAGWLGRKTYADEVAARIMAAAYAPDRFTQDV